MRARRQLKMLGWEELLESKVASPGDDSAGHGRWVSKGNRPRFGLLKPRRFTAILTIPSVQRSSVGERRRAGRKTAAISA